MHGYLPYDGDRTCSNLQLPASHHLLRRPQDRQILGALFYWGCLGKLALTKCPVPAHS